MMNAKQKCFEQIFKDLVKGDEDFELELSKGPNGIRLRAASNGYQWDGIGQVFILEVKTWRQLLNAITSEPHP